MNPHLRIQDFREGTRPMNNTRDTAARLDAWSVAEGAGPEEVHVQGSITGHPRQHVTPSPYTSTAIIEAPTHWPWHEGDVVRSLNTWLVLGRPADAQT